MEVGVIREGGSKVAGREGDPAMYNGRVEHCVARKDKFEVSDFEGVIYIGLCWFNIKNYVIFS